MSIVYHNDVTGNAVSSLFFYLATFLVTHILAAAKNKKKEVSM